MYLFSCKVCCNCFFFFHISVDFWRFLTIFSIRYPCSERITKCQLIQMSMVFCRRLVGNNFFVSCMCRLNKLSQLGTKRTSHWVQHFWKVYGLWWVLKVYKNWFLPKNFHLHKSTLRNQLSMIFTDF